MRTVKNTLSIILTFCIILPLFSVTGCSKFKEAMERQRIKQSEEDALRIDKANDFLRFYEKNIKNALVNKDKSALKDLFCQTVIDTTADMENGLEYIVNLEDWSTYSGGADNCYSIKEYADGGHWEYFIAHTDIKANDVRYRMFFEGFGLYYGPHSEFIAENVGLAKLYIGRLDDNGDVTGLPCTELNGIYHPGREQVEKIISAVLNEPSTIDAIESVMSPELLNSADKNELEAFYEFAELDPKRKKNAIFFFIGEQDGGFVVSSVVYTNLGDRCISLLIKEDMLSGAKLSDDENMKKPVINQIKGFEL